MSTTALMTDCTCVANARVVIVQAGSEPYMHCGQHAFLHHMPGQQSAAGRMAGSRARLA